MVSPFSCFLPFSLFSIYVCHNCIILHFQLLHCAVMYFVALYCIIMCCTELCYIAHCNVLFSLNRPSGPIQSISCDVRLSVCVCVCMSPLVKYRLNVFLPPFTKVLGKNLFVFLDSLGKSYRKEVV